MRTVCLVFAYLAIAAAIPGLAAAGADPPRTTGLPAGGGDPPRTTGLVRLGTPALRPAGSRVAGSLVSSSPLAVTVALTPRDPAALAAYAKAVSEPGSGSYRRFLTVRRFAQRFGASSAEIDGVIAALRARGLRPGRPAADGLSIPVRGTAGAVSAAFHTTLERIRLRGGRVAFANTSAPAVGRAVAPDVEAIIGLNTIARPIRAGLPKPPPPPAASGRAAGHRADHGAAVAAAPRAAGPAPCSAATTQQANFDATTDYHPYTINQVAAAYQFTPLYTAGDLGAGSTVALYELEGNFPADTTGYQKCFGTTGTVSTVKVDGGAPAPSAAEDDGFETQIDIDNVIGLAPKANLLVYQGPDTAQGAYDTDQAIVVGDKASILSQSWGLCESQLGANVITAEGTLFEEAAVEGITVLASSGDTGSGDCDDASSPGDTQPAVDDPASQPYVTGVGGTELSSLTGPVESAWNDLDGSGGGGTSGVWGVPSFQADAAANVSVTGSSQSRIGTCPGATSGGFCRQVPDVSAEADSYTGYMVYWGGTWTVGGGTSASTPLWAALVALAQSSSTCDGARLGFINPTLYGGAGAQYADDFNDVTSGNNAWIAGMDPFTASPGYDPVTGLGTPKAAGDVSMLCAGPLSVSTPASETTVADAPVTAQVVASAAHGQPVTLSATGVPSGVTFNPATGTFAGTPDVPSNGAVTVEASTSTQVQQISFPWNVTRPAVTVAALKPLLTSIDKRVHVQVRASVNAPVPISYQLNGAPSGLSIASTGVISGKADQSGRFRVSVTASSALAFPVTSAPVTWIVKGPAQLRLAEISGVAHDRATLSFTVKTGYGVPCVRIYTFGAPSGLTFPQRGFARHVSLRSSVADDHVKLRFKASLDHGAARIDTRGQPACGVQVTVSGLRASRQLRRTLRAHRHRPTLRKVTVVVGSGDGATRTLHRRALVS